VEERNLLLTARKNSPYKSEECLVQSERRANETVTQLGEELNVRVVDLNSILPKSSEYFADLAHFTDKGASLAALAFSRTLLGLEDGRRPERPPDARSGSADHVR
jgi:hypothetical protein